MFCAAITSFVSHVRTFIGEILHVFMTGFLILLDEHKETFNDENTSNPVNHYINTVHSYPGGGLHIRRCFQSLTPANTGRTQFCFLSTF